MNNHPKKSIYASVRPVLGLMLLSLVVYVAFRFFICDDNALTCRSAYDIGPMAIGATIMLLSIIGIALIVILGLKFLRRKRGPQNLQFMQTNDNEPDSQ